MKCRQHIQNNKNKIMLESNLAKRPIPASSVHGLMGFYGIWISLAGLSAWLGHSQIDVISALFLIGGISSTAFFFLTLSRTKSASPEFSRWLAIYQTVIAIGWISLYFFFSRSTGTLVLGMYLTVLMAAVFYLELKTILRLCGLTLATYLLVIASKILAIEPGEPYLLADSIGFLVLLAVVSWTYIFARQLRDLRIELQERNEEMQTVIDRVTRIAERDYLTKSYNRRYIMDALARERSLANRSGKAFATLLFDLDHFKSINDRYGHLVGDEILAAFARKVKAELRGMDTVNATDHKRSFGRYGGEEFIAVLPETELLGAQRCAERIRKLIADHAFRGDYRVTVSVGVAEYRPGESVPELLTRADQALYQAKRDGRNLVRCSEKVFEEFSATVPKLRILK
jgi:diguanylate cyclase (GGDEF)-like protein